MRVQGAIALTIFRILGPIEAAVGDRVLSLGGRRQLTLFAFLLMHANRTVSSDALSDAVWGPGRPGADNRLQMAVARLRRALEPLNDREGQRLRTAGGGYLLSVAPGDLDADVFETGIQEGQQALDGNQPRRAAEILREALSLWRGPPFAEVTYEDYAQGEIRRLEELRLIAIEARVDADLQAGHNAQLIGELEALVAEHPTREHFVGQLMLALYQSGRQAHALDIYQRTRMRFATELGLEPGPTLKALQKDILEQASSLGAVGKSVRLRERRSGRLSEAEPAVQAGTVIDTSFRAPLPSRLRPYGPPIFVDRRDEREALARTLRETMVSGRRAVFVTGEPGIGKTRLVSEVAVEAHAAGVLVLAGRCDEGLGLSYQPFVEALGHLVEHCPGDLLDEHLRDYGDAVARLVPALARRAGGSFPGTEAQHTDSDRYLMYAAIEDLLLSVAHDSSLLLVLEDLHWADLPTLVLLRFLVTSPRSAPFCVLCTSRLEELGDDHALLALLADLHREPTVSRVELHGLGDQDVRALVGAVAEIPPHADAARLTAEVRSGTGGNPFFITELMKNLAEFDELTASHDQWSPAGRVDWVGRLPRSINETILRRVHRLGSEVEHVLGSAAVAGDEFDLDLVAAIAHGEAVADSLDRAARAGLLIEVNPEGPRFRFAHALVRRCLYTELGLARRAELHGAVAVALEPRLDSGRVSAAEVAAHWLVAAGASESDKPLRFAVLAGDQAVAKLAPDEARRWYEIALERLGAQGDASSDERCELLIKRGAAERQAGHPGFRETLLEAAAIARAADNPDALVRAALANTRGLQSATGTVDLERVATLEVALLAVGTADSPARARLLALQAAELTFHDRVQCVELSDQAVTIARRLGDPAALSMVLTLRFVTIWTPEMLAERLANTKEALAACDQLDDPLASFHACHWRGVACLEAAEVNEARRWVKRERELADRIRQPTSLWLTAGAEANLAIVDGRLPDAERIAAHAFEIGQRGEPDAFACYAAQLAAILFEKGELGPLVSVLEQTVEQNPGIPGFRSTLALSLCEADRRSEAREVLEIDAASNFRDLAHDATWLAVACIFAEVATRVPDARSAAVLRRLLEPCGGMIAVPGWGPWGPVDRYLGMLARIAGDLDGASHHIRRAEETASRVNAPLWLARTRLELARVHALLDDLDAAHDLLIEVTTVADRHDAHGLVREASSELAALAKEPA